MDSKKIVSIFFFFVSFLIPFHESQARTLHSESALHSPPPPSAPGPSNEGCSHAGTLNCESAPLSPSPSAAPGPSDGCSHAQSPGFRSPLPSPSPSPAPGPSQDGCWLLSTSCRSGSLTACIDPSSAASKKLVLFIKNDGEKPLNVKIAKPLPKDVIQVLPYPEHQIKKVNITANPGRNTTIRLEAGNLVCVIRIESQVSGGGILDYIPLPMRMTRIKAAYLLFLTGLIVIGSAWACCKRGERGRQGDGIRYQELEMEQPHSLSANNVETAEGWEHDWGGDTDWDDLKSKANGSANSLTSRLPKRDDRENTWDD